MATTSPTRTAPRPLLGRSRPGEPVDRRAVRGRDPPRRGPGRRRWTARRPDRQAHRPLARGQVHRPRAGLRGEDLVGHGQPTDQRGALRPPSRPADRVRRRPRPLQPGLLHRRRTGPPPVAPRVHRDRLGEHLRAQPVPPADGRPVGRLRARTSRSSACPSFQADPATEGTRTGTAILVHLRPDGGDHRRHRIRGRDQEVRVHGDELPDARRGRPADALGDQRRRRRRRGGLLRAVGDGQDDAVGRPAAQPCRRRRTRLGRRASPSTSRVAATPRRSASRRCTSRTSSRRPGASGRSSRTSTSTR